MGLRLVGGWVRGQKKVCVPKINLQFQAPLINSICSPRNNFLTWVGGWVTWSSGRPKTPPPPKLVRKGLAPQPKVGTNRVGPLFGVHPAPTPPRRPRSSCTSS